ncbi:MAG TPA: DUF222 domain-containing protein [Streptosporangiaceae bacterium]
MTLQVRQPDPTPTPASPTQALAAARAWLGTLAAADLAALPAQAQAEILHGLEQLEAMITAARAWTLSAFTAGQGYAADANYSARAWLIHKTRVTRGAAAGHIGWSRRAAAHPQVLAALAEGTIVTESLARKLCGWTDQLPGGCRQAADEILLAAARAGADERDLAGLAAEIRARAPQDTTDDDPGFENRCLRLETTIDGAGVLNADLTPECAAIVSAVLDALSAPMGAEDTRTQGQRYHDGLQEAMRRLAASGLLPERAGQPVKAWAHVSLAELCALDAGSVLQGEWITAVQAKWAGARAAASVAGGDGGAWLDGPAARAVTCDAIITPVVTGDVDTTVLDHLVKLCVQLDRLDHAPGQAEPAAATALASPAREALQKAIIGKAVDLLSGPGGLASFLRTQQLGARLGGPSLPLDIGYSETVPAAIRNAVILRDRHCQWAGGCHQPARACEVHHVKHKADGGPTSVKECVLLCFFHHQVCIHRWGWTLVLNSDGTTTAWNPDRTKVLHSHSPPARAG